MCAALTRREAGLQLTRSSEVEARNSTGLDTWIETIYADCIGLRPKGGGGEAASARESPEWFGGVTHFGTTAADGVNRPAAPRAH